MRRRRYLKSPGSLIALTVAGGLMLTLVTPASSVLAGTSRTTAGRVAGGPSGVTAPEAAIANARTGAILWSRELNTQRPIASITKVMTALVVLRSGGLYNTITIPRSV